MQQRTCCLLRLVVTPTWEVAVSQEAILIYLLFGADVVGEAVLDELQSVGPCGAARGLALRLTRSKSDHAVGHLEALALCKELALVFHCVGLQALKRLVLGLLQGCELILMLFADLGARQFDLGCDFGLLCVSLGVGGKCLFGLPGRDAGDDCFFLLFLP